MKRWIIFLPVWLVSCSLNDNSIESPQLAKHASRTIQYMHLAVGDSLGYDWSSTNAASIFTHVVATNIIGNKTYYHVVDYPLGPASPFELMIRQDEDGNVYAIFPSDSGVFSRQDEILLFKTAADTGTTWDVEDIITGTLISRSDTVKTFYATFPNCLRIRIDYNWYSSEEQWLAPGVGLVRREYYTAGMYPVFMPALDLKDLRLKTASRR